LQSPELNLFYDIFRGEFHNVFPSHSLHQCLKLLRLFKFAIEHDKRLLKLSVLFPHSRQWMENNGNKEDGESKGKRNDETMKALGRKFFVPAQLIVT
jgi:hypothetical protein